MRFFADGTLDRRHYRDGLILSAAAKRAGFPTRFESFPGGHNFRMVHSALTALLPSIADSLSDGMPDAGRV